MTTNLILAKSCSLIFPAYNVVLTHYNTYFLENVYVGLLAGNGEVSASEWKDESPEV